MALSPRDWLLRGTSDLTRIGAFSVVTRLSLDHSAGMTCSVLNLLFPVMSAVRQYHDRCVERVRGRHVVDEDMLTKE